MILTGCSSSQDPEKVPGKVTGKYVSIEKTDTHYNVVIDYTTGATRSEVGKEYGELIKQILPDFETVVDSCLADFNNIGNLEQQYSQLITPQDNNYAAMIANVAKIKPQIPVEYRDEIEGLASAMSGGTTDTVSDNKLSVDEVYILSILPDVIRACQCNGVGVWGSLSSTGNNMVGRTLDFYSGSKRQFAQCNAVTTIKNNDSSICLVGFLGQFCAVTVFNKAGVFAGILDSPELVSNTGNFNNSPRSYVMDLRYAVELAGYTSLEDVAGYMTDNSRNYVFNHNILLADKTDTQVVENDLLHNRALRNSTSQLRSGVSWNFTEAICVVNSFVLDGNFDNHSGNTNSKRWASFTSQLTGAVAGGKITPDALRSVMSYHDLSDADASIYRGPEYEAASIWNTDLCSIQQVFYVPATGELKAYFLPVSGPLENPVFKDITVNFN